MAAGTEVEGLGTVHPLLNIGSSEVARVVETGNATYWGYNTSAPSNSVNAGLEGGKGISDNETSTTYNAIEDWQFTFAPGISISDFSIQMFDYGDFFPFETAESMTHTVTLEAWDASETTLIASDVLTFTSTGTGSMYRTSGTTWSYGGTDLHVAGDAYHDTSVNLTRDPDDSPGYWEFEVSGSGIEKIKIVFDGNQSIDPGIAFDYIEFTIIEEKCADLMAGQHIDVGDVNVWNDDTSLYVQYVLDDPWVMTESHLHVATAWEAIPQKNGNPPPGQFDYSMEHACVTEYTYVIELDEGWVPCETDLYIAAHAVVIGPSGDCENPFWATGQEEYSPGLDVDGDPILYGVTYYSTDTKMLGAPDVTSLGPPLPEWDGFQSLGFGGSVVITFDSPIFNSSCDYDISVHEVTGTTAEGRASYPEESAEVWVLYDGDWYFAGTVTNHDNGDGIGKVSIPAGLPYAEAVKLVDTTNPANFPVPPYYIADGYDVDAVDACFLYNLEETAWGYCEENGGEFPGKNWATYLTYHVQ